MSYRIVFAPKALKQLKFVKTTTYKDKLKKILESMEENPVNSCYSFEKLKLNLKDCNSKRLNIQHRVVYKIYEDTKTVKVLSIWGHYEK